MEWPSLEDMSLFECDKLNRLFWGHQSALSLKYLNISEECFEKMIWEDDEAASRFNSLLRVPVFTPTVVKEARKEKDIGRSIFMDKEFDALVSQMRDEAVQPFAKNLENFMHQPWHSGTSDKQEARPFDTSGQWHIGETSSVHDVSVDEEEPFFDCEC